MKIMAYETYGSPDVFEMKTANMPQPKADQLLIQVWATTVTSADCRIRSLTMPKGFGLISRLVFGIQKPKNKVLGVEFAGVVQAIGEAVTQFKIGDQVLGINGAQMGCYAEYLCISEKGAITFKPDALSFQEAVTLPFGGTTALDFFRRAKLKTGESVLINGASGNVGTAAIQLAVNFGAEVTAICSASNRDYVLQLGASHVIDYTQTDLQQLKPVYDVIMDTVGNLPYAHIQHALKPQGRLLQVAANLTDMLRIPWIQWRTKHQIIAGPAKEQAEDLDMLVALTQAGTYRPLIDRVYAFGHLSEAHRYVDSGRKRGSVVIGVKEEATP